MAADLPDVATNSTLGNPEHRPIAPPAMLAFTPSPRIAFEIAHIRPRGMRRVTHRTDLAANGDIAVEEDLAACPPRHMEERCSTY